jgi:hypothetical protein
MEWSEIGYIAIGIVATLIGSLAIKFLDFKINRLGDLSIYAKIIKQQQNIINLKIEIKNTKNDVCFVRQMKLFTVVNSEKTYYMQGDYSINKQNGLEEKEFFGNKGNYSFTIQAKTIEHYELMFVSKIPVNIEKIERIGFEYYNDKDKKICIYINPKLKEWQKAN